MYKHFENLFVSVSFYSFSNSLQVGIKILFECFMLLNSVKLSCLVCTLSVLQLFLQFFYFNRIPEQYLCYLNDTKYPTAKFDLEQDQAGDIGWSCIGSDDKECIPKRFICDKTNDCSYGSDELKGCDLYPGIKK